MARGATSILHHAKSVRRQPTFSPLDKSRRVFLFAFFSLVVLASGCAIFYIATHIQAVNLGYKIGQELQRKEELIEDNKRLSLEIARLKSPIRIEAEAKETLGLELPKTQQVFYLSRWEPDSLVKVAAAVTPPAMAKGTADKPAEKSSEPAKLAAAPSTEPKPKILAKKTESSPAQKAPETAKLSKAEPAAKVAAAKPVESAKIAKLEQAVPSKPIAKASETKTLVIKPAAKTETPETNLALKKNQPAKPVSAAKTEPVVALKTPIPDKAMAAAAKEPQATDAKKPVAEKQETAKATKSSAKPVPQESRVAKREASEILVARIVEKDSSREKIPNKLKSGPSLAYQPKDKVPAVMLDPMP